MDGKRREEALPVKKRAGESASSSKGWRRGGTTEYKRRRRTRGAAWEWEDKNTKEERKGGQAGKGHNSNEGFQRPSLTRRHPAAPKGSSGPPATGCSPGAWLCWSPDGPVPCAERKGRESAGDLRVGGVVTGPHPFKFSIFKQGTSPQETEGERERARCSCRRCLSTKGNRLYFFLKSLSILFGPMLLSSRCFIHSRKDLLVILFESSSKYSSRRSSANSVHDSALSRISCTRSRISGTCANEEGGSSH